jgi:hypothetical protein
VPLIARKRLEDGYRSTAKDTISLGDVAVRRASMLWNRCRRCAPFDGLLEIATHAAPEDPTL